MWHTYSVTFPLRNLSPSATPSRLPCLRHLHLFFIHSVRQFAETNISERSLNLLINYVKISVCPFWPNCMGQVLPGQQFSVHFDRRRDPPYRNLSTFYGTAHAVAVAVAVAVAAVDLPTVAKATCQIVDICAAISYTARNKCCEN